MVSMSQVTSSYLKQINVDINSGFTEMRLYVSHCLTTNLMSIPHPHAREDLIVAYLYITIKQLIINLFHFIAV